MGKAFIVGHGVDVAPTPDERALDPTAPLPGDDMAGKIFVPPFTTVSYYTDVDLPLPARKGVATVNTGALPKPHRRFEAGAVMPNYQLSTLERGVRHNYEASVSSLVDGALYYIGITAPVAESPLRLCTTPETCRAAAWEAFTTARSPGDSPPPFWSAHDSKCRGVLARLAENAETDLHVLACRVRIDVKPPDRKRKRGDRNGYSTADAMSKLRVRLLERAATDAAGALMEFADLPSATQAALRSYLDMQLWLQQMHHTPTGPDDTAFKIFLREFRKIAPDSRRLVWEALPDENREALARNKSAHDLINDVKFTRPGQPRRVARDFKVLDRATVETLLKRAQANPATFRTSWENWPQYYQEMLISICPELGRYLHLADVEVPDVPPPDRLPAVKLAEWAGSEPTVVLGYWHALDDTTRHRLAAHPRVRRWLQRTGQLAAEPSRDLPPPSLVECGQDVGWWERFYRWLDNRSHQEAPAAVMLLLRQRLAELRLTADALPHQMEELVMWLHQWGNPPDDVFSAMRQVRALYEYLADPEVGRQTARRTPNSDPVTYFLASNHDLAAYRASCRQRLTAQGIVLHGPALEDQLPPGLPEDDRQDLRQLWHFATDNRTFEELNGEEQGLVPLAVTPSPQLSREELDGLLDHARSAVDELAGSVDRLLETLYGLFLKGHDDHTRQHV
ncbi:putative adhesin [Lentzea sp. NPDC051208]|uniref:putative adhesin n=1 Tax=Lentzea sp. NPDC051208 TaxID=3154642 RepID=UPI0034482933